MEIGEAYAQAMARSLLETKESITCDLLFELYSRRPRRLKRLTGEEVLNRGLVVRGIKYRSPRADVVYIDIRRYRRMLRKAK